jgi:hypothetical protein
MQPDKWMGQMRGIVQTIEQKSGLNPILFIVALISLPSLFLYAFTNKEIFLWLICAPVGLFFIIYIVTFFIDRSFLRSEKFVYDMKQLDVLGEKGNERPEKEILEIKPVTATPNKRLRKEK